MKHFRFLLLYIALFTACSFSPADTKNNASQRIVLAGSTPGDSIVKSMLGIAQATQIDFIRWHLNLHTAGESADSFYLDISFGMSKPNTLGFMDDYGKKTYSGTYSIKDRDSKTIKGRIFQFTAHGLAQTLSIVQVDDNVFHLLSPANRLIGGNGGWSYTLNRVWKTDVSPAFAAVFKTTGLFQDTATQVTFDGRTPCTIARDYQMGTSTECFKLKWRLILYRDAQNKTAGTYRINRITNGTQQLTGRWVIREHPVHASAQILQLDPDQPDRSLTFLIADNDVLFFLNKNHELYLGNKDFSYTLNRKTW